MFKIKKSLTLPYTNRNLWWHPWVLRGFILYITQKKNLVMTLHVSLSGILKVIYALVSTYLESKQKLLLDSLRLLDWWSQGGWAAVSAAWETQHKHTYRDGTWSIHSQSCMQTQTEASEILLKGEKIGWIGGKIWVSGNVLCFHLKNNVTLQFTPTQPKI